MRRAAGRTRYAAQHVAGRPEVVAKAMTIAARRSAAMTTAARHCETTAALLLPVAGESARRPEVVAKATTTPVYPRET